MKPRHRLTGLVATMAVVVLVAAGCASSRPVATQVAAGASATPTPADTIPPLDTPSGSSPSPAVSGPALSWKPILASGGSAPQATKLQGGIVAAVAYGKGFVLAGSESATGPSVIWFSPDGSRWQAIDDVPGFADGAINQLVVFKGGLLAFGTARQLSSDCATADLSCNPVMSIRLWESSDGITWHALASTIAAQFGRAQLHLVVAGSAGLVAFGEKVPAKGAAIAGTVWVSADGRDWDEQPQFSSAFPTDTMLDLAAGKTGYIAVGARSAGGNLTFPRRAWYSSNGAVWHLGSGPAASQGPVLIRVAATGFLGVENPTSQASFWSSTDGVNWLLQPPVTDRPNYPAYVGAGIYSDGNRIVAMGTDPFQSPGAWVTTDARTWQPLVLSGPQTPIASGTIVGALGLGGLLVITAPDTVAGGKTWTIWLGTIV
jgi:hypothetical protein